MQTLIFPNENSPMPEMKGEEDRQMNHLAVLYIENTGFARFFSMGNCFVICAVVDVQGRKRDITSQISNYWIVIGIEDNERDGGCPDTLNILPWRGCQ
jgi:hypothetical protein